MHTSRIRGTVVALLAGSLLMAGSPAIAYSQSPQSGDAASPKPLVSTTAIVNFKSGKRLQAASSSNGAHVTQQPASSNNLNRWYTVLAGDYVSFENFQSGLNLGIDGASSSAGAVAITATPSGATNQDWTRTSVGSGVWTLKNRKSGLCLGISGASTATGAQAAQFACDGSANQKWTFPE